jgi:hypothetical protein
MAKTSFRAAQPLYAARLIKGVIVAGLIEQGFSEG